MGLLDKLLLVGAGGGAAVWYYTKGITDCTAAVLKQQGTLFQTVQKPGRHADVCQAGISTPEVNAAELARAFWTSSVLSTERKLLAAANAGVARTDEEIRKMAFEVGDQVGPFVVVGKTPREVLFCWDEKIGGYSWLAVTEDGKVQFGSALDKAGYPIVQALLPFHLIYARICLASAQRNLDPKVQ